jgi:hypothetical protein
MGKRRARKPTLEEMLQTLQASFEDRLGPPLGGFAYRFTIFLPLLSEGKEVFSRVQCQFLGELFHACCAGFTETSAEGHPPWYGSWAPPGAARPVIDRHKLIVVYTPQTDEAKDFFGQLRWILEQEQVAKQDAVLIEHTTVWLVEPSPLRGEAAVS